MMTLHHWLRFHLHILECCVEKGDGNNKIEKFLHSCLTYEKKNCKYTNLKMETLCLISCDVADVSFRFPPVTHRNTVATTTTDEESKIFFGLTDEKVSLTH